MSVVVLDAAQSNCLSRALSREGGVSQEEPLNLTGYDKPIH